MPAGGKGFPVRLSSEEITGLNIQTVCRSRDEEEPDGTVRKEVLSCAGLPGAWRQNKKGYTTWMRKEAKAAMQDFRGKCSCKGAWIVIG